jgi:chromosomal replication initiator protein
MSAKPTLRASAKPVEPPMDEIWRRAADRLRALLGLDVYNSWFGSLRLEDITGGRARLTVSTRFLKSWIEGHYLEKVLTALAAEREDVVAVEIHARSCSGAPLRIAEPQPEAAPDPEPTRPRMTETPRAPLGSPLDRRLTFATFVAGRANQLALSLARKFCETADPAMTPLYFHGAVGLGKTHLLQAIAHAAQARRQAVGYLTAETFMYGFVTALRSQSAIAFKEQLRAIDLLIFDDAQFLQGKVIQSEFGHVLNALIEAGKQVVIAADRPPSELESVDERVRSRLAGGICVELQAFDEALRLKILEARLAAARLNHPGLDIPAEVLTFLAQAVTSNGRDLEGAVNRLVAHAQLGGQPMTVAAAEVAVRDLIRPREPKRVKIEDIQKRVATHYNVSRADLLSSRRTAAVVMPRQIAMYLAKSLTLRSLPEIGRRFGGRDHTTVLHAVRKIDNLYNNDTALRDEIELLKRMLQE